MNDIVMHVAHYLDNRPLCWTQGQMGSYLASADYNRVNCPECISIVEADQREEDGCICPGPHHPGNQHVNDCPLNPAKKAYDALAETLKMTDQQIKELKEYAERLECNVYQIRSSHGEFMLTPLLVARAQVLSGMALLHYQGYQ